MRATKIDTLSSGDGVITKEEALIPRASKRRQPYPKSKEWELRWINLVLDKSKDRGERMERELQNM
ncbi:hypothetical protein ACTXT7_013880 [Hymenolepis weldensis]